MIKIKRIYEKPEKDDGYRIYIDRLWARGLKKEDAGINEWMKDIAPSTELRKWFAHDPAKWNEFKKKYSKELNSKKEYVNSIKQLEKEHKTVTLLFSARDKNFNNARALMEYLKN